MLMSCTVLSLSMLCFFFFFQAEDGIRDATVTGVQTCALPILNTRAGLVRAGRAGRPMAEAGIHSAWHARTGSGHPPAGGVPVRTPGPRLDLGQIGRASCRERV